MLCKRYAKRVVHFPQTVHFTTCTGQLETGNKKHYSYDVSPAELGSTMIVLCLLHPLCNLVLLVQELLLLPELVLDRRTFV